MRVRFHGSRPQRLALFSAWFAVLVASLVAWSASAMAGEFTASISCGYAGRTAEYWQAPATPGGWSKVCLDDGVGMRLQATAETTEDWRPTAWQFPKTIRPGVKIKHVTAVVRGSDGSPGGLAQGLQLASRANGTFKYGALRSVTESPDGQSQTIELDGADVEGGADQLLLSGRCTIALCSPQAAFEVVSLQVTFSEETLPSLNVTPTYSQMASRWTNSILLALYDSGSGVSSVVYEATDAEGGSPRVWIEPTIDCRATSIEPYMCVTTRGGSVVIKPDDALLRHDGVNFLKTTVYDKAGNAASRVVEVRVDFTPPSAAQELKFDIERFPGWIAEPYGVLRWRNTGEIGETDRHSGLSEVTVRLVPLDGQLETSLSTTDQLIQTEESSRAIVFPSGGRWRVEVELYDALRNKSEVATKDIGIDNLPPPVPALDIEPWYGPNQPAVRWTAVASVNPQRSGGCDFESRFDHGPWESTDGANQIDFASETAHGLHSVAVRSVSCADVRSESDEQMAKYDSSRPSVEFRPPHLGWLNGGESLVLSADDDGSGVSKIAYSVDNGFEQTVAADATSLVLPDGAHIVRAESEDRAGNRSHPVSFSAQFDSVAPSGWIEPFDADRPTLVSGVVSDAHSGIATSKVQYRAAGADDWRDLETDSQALGAQSLRLQARFPDDDVTVGAYELRIVATDHAGYFFSTGDRRVDGTAATLSSPLRQRPRVRASMVERKNVRCGRSAKVSSRRKCFKQISVEDTTVDFGQWSTMRGDVLDANGRPVPHGKVVVLADEEPIDGKRVAIASGETSHDGHFEISIPPGVSRKLTAMSPGSERSMSAEDTAVVRTRTSVTLSANRRRARPGQRVVFKGRVRLGSASLSNLGLHYLITSADSEISIKDRRTDPSGRFSVNYVIPRFGRPVTLRLRAAVRHEYGWPYSAGVSKTVSIKVAR